MIVVTNLPTTVHVNTFTKVMKLAEQVSNAVKKTTSNVRYGNMGVLHFRRDILSLVI